MEKKSQLGQTKSGNVIHFEDIDWLSKEYLYVCINKQGAHWG